jgi:hypothetical protein
MRWKHEAVNDMTRKKAVILCGILACIALPLILYAFLFRPYGPQFRSSELISDLHDCSISFKDDSGKLFEGFENETRVTITLYSLFLGEVEVLLPISDSSSVAGRNFTISSNANETVRPFVKYAQNITFFGLQQGDGIAHVTVPPNLNENAMLGMRQQLVLNFSSADMQHLIKFYLRTEGRSFTVTQRLFPCPELQFIGVPDSNPFFESFSTNQFGSEIRISGESVYTDYRLRLSDSYRQQQYYGNTLNTAILTFIASIGISSAALFVSTYRFFTEAHATKNSTTPSSRDRGSEGSIEETMKKVEPVKNQAQFKPRANVLLEEYKSLRTEVMERQTARLYIAAFTIAAIGTIVGFTLRDDMPSGYETAYFVSALVSFALIVVDAALVLTIQYTQQIRMISSYIRRFIEPRMPELRWETYWTRYLEKKSRESSLINFMLGTSRPLAVFYAFLAIAACSVVFLRGLYYTPVVIPALLLATLSLVLSYDLYAKKTKLWSIDWKIIDE